MKKLTLMATVRNGVEVVDVIDYPGAEILDNRDFINSLDSLDENERIFTMITPKNTDGNFEEIDSEYGIN